MALVPKTGNIKNGSDQIGYRSPSTFYGAPLSGTPVTPPITSGDNRIVGNDSINSYIVLETSASNFILHRKEWFVEFWTASTNIIVDARVYAENRDNTNNLIYSVGAGNPDETKVRVFIRDASVTTQVDVTNTITAFKDGENHFVRAERTADGDIIISVDGVSETLATGISGTFDVANTQTFGAQQRLTVAPTRSGLNWDINKNGQFIPLNEGTGTDIYDSDGTLVGTLIDPDGTFWDYSVATWTLVEDKSCDNNKLLLNDDNIALVDDDNNFLYED